MDGINNLVMKRKPKLKIDESSFGRRLARLRKAQGLTQQELADRLGISRRMVVYYEAQSEHIPAGLLPQLAQALKVSADELLGLRSLKVKDPEESLRLFRKLKRITRLPARQRRAVLEYAEALLERNQSS